MSDYNPPVTVVLPVYNRESLIDKSIQSVLDQTYNNFELVIVDDGSTDSTVDVIENFIDERIRVIKHETNKGASAARNTWIREANGEFIAFQDSDDEWVPYKLEKQVGLFRHTPDDVGVVYTGMWRMIDGNLKYLPYINVHPKEGAIMSSLVKQNFISTQVAMVKRKCFDVSGYFDERFGVLNDWELWLRIAENFEFRLLDEPLVISRLRTDSISNDQEALVDTRRTIVEKHRDKFDTVSLANHLFYIGHGSLKAGKRSQGQTYLQQAILENPRPIYLLSYLISFLGCGIYQRIYFYYKGAHYRNKKTRLQDGSTALIRFKAKIHEYRF